MLNFMLSFLNTLENVVFWVRDPITNQQLYINKAYDKIWHRNGEDLYNHPASFGETLLSEDEAFNMSQFQHRAGNSGINAIAYRIFLPNGEIRWLKDTCLSLINPAGKVVLACGISELIEPETWYQVRSGKLTPTTDNSQLQSISELFYKEFQLQQHPAKTALQENTNCKQQSYLKINNTTIHLTRRQQECLKYLLDGKSAKETAYYLDISTRTVETYLGVLRNKFNCRSNIALVSKINEQSMQDLVITDPAGRKCQDT